METIELEPKTGACQIPFRSPELSIVLPTYNERGNVAEMVARLEAALSGMLWEAIFVDDDSPDRTFDVVRAIGATDPRIRCIRRINRRGRASACLEGMLAAQAPIIAVMDADLQHDPGVLPTLFALLRENRADIVVPTRYRAGGSNGGLKGLRDPISRSAGAFARAILRVKLSDPTSGYFAARREVIDGLAARLSPDGFNTLLDIVSADRRLRLTEVPYVFGVRHNGESKLRARVALDYLALIFSRASGGLVPQRFFLFALVGVSGVAVHLAFLLGLEQTGFAFAQAQSLAALIAAASNFWMNNALTYRDQSLRGAKALAGLAIYVGVCSLGIVSNVGIALWLFTDSAATLLPGLGGALVSAVWNYAVTRALIWRS